jgi:hypothetical protein
MSDAVYPYRVTFNRTAQWYPNSSTYGNGDWIKISEWCDSSIGPGNWDYYWNEFVFSREEDYMLFKLKWL